MRQLILLALASSLSFACSSGSSGRSDAVSSSGGDSVAADGSDGSDGSDGTGAGDGSDGTAGGPDASTDGSSGGPDVIDGPDTTEESDATAEEDTFLPPVGDVCGVAIAGGLPVGAPCTEHEQCGTGYCYDEELFNEDGQIVNRFCTAKCGGCTTVSSCNEWPKAAGVEENKCYPLTSSFINKHALAASSVCLVGCINDSDCAALGQFSVCRLLRFDGNCSYGVVKVCQPESFSGSEVCE